MSILLGKQNQGGRWWLISRQSRSAPLMADKSAQKLNLRPFHFSVFVLFFLLSFHSV